MAKQVYYQNLPIPSNNDAIPTYLNNELQILGNVISELDLKINSSGTSSDTVQSGIIEDEINALDVRVSNNEVEINNLINNDSKLSISIDANTSDINDLTKSISNMSSYIDSTKNDNIITISQKSQIYSDWQVVYNEYVLMMTSSANHNIDNNSYNLAYTSLKQYLISDPINIDLIPTNGLEWCNNQSNIYIDGEQWRTLWNTYRYQKQLLDSAIIDSLTNKTIWNEINVDGATMTAEQAAVDAASALSLITNISSDGYITPSEKTGLFIEWKSIYDEKIGITTQGTNASVSTTAYNTAYTTLYNMMISAPISIQNPPTDGTAWCTDTNSIAIDSAVFRANYTSYYNERQLLLNAVSTSYNLKFTEIASDNKITQGEKSSLYVEWKTIYEEKPGILAQGTNASVSTTNYTNAYNALVTYLTTTPLSMPTNPTSDNGSVWCSDINTITVVGTTFRSNFATYYNERQLLLNAVTTSVKTTADTANSTANTANSNANTALSQANTAISGLSDKLSKTANTVLSGAGAVIAGSLVINSSGGRSSGSGVALTSAGIAGYNSSGNATFAIDTSGNATFAGALSAASGTFSGTLSSVNGTFTGQLISGSSITGNLQITTNGSISSGMTSYATGTGYWIEYNSGTPRFSIGTGSAGTITNGFSWNGSTATFAGNLLVSGTPYATSSFLNSNTTASDVGLGNVSNLTPANQTSTGLNAGTTITGGGITMSSGGTIKGGKTGFADTTNAGFVIGYGTGPSLNQYGFKFGNGDMSKGIQWNGTDLNMNGGTLQVGSSPTISGTTMTGTGARFEADGNWCAGNATTNISFNGTQMTLNGEVVLNGNLSASAVSTIKVAANAISTYWYTYSNIATALTTAGGGISNTSVPITIPDSGSLFLSTWAVVHNNSTASDYRVQHYGSVTVRDPGGSVVAVYSLGPSAWKTIPSGPAVSTSYFGTYASGNNGSMEYYNLIWTGNVDGGNTVTIQLTCVPATTQSVLTWNWLAWQLQLLKR